MSGSSNTLYNPHSYAVSYVVKLLFRTNTHKLINKAVANIQAVERGMFGVGH